jgi:hypothetical protein
MGPCPHSSTVEQRTLNSRSRFRLPLGAPSEKLESMRSKQAVGLELVEVGEWVGFSRKEAQDQHRPISSASWEWKLERTNGRHSSVECNTGRDTLHW